MAKTLNAGAITTKWQQRASGAAGAYKDGVNAVTEAPGAAAVRNSQAYIQHVTESYNNGRWAARTSAVTAEAWKAAASTKGANNYPGGITAGAPKMQQFMTNFIPHLQSGMAAVAAMPKVTIQDSINRAGAMIMHNHEFKNR